MANNPKPRKPKLTERQGFTIRLALRAEYERSMEFLNLHSFFASHYLVQAGEAWDAYKAFTGYPIHDKPFGAR